MDQATHNKIVSFIRGIADDVLRDLFRRGKYLDVTYPLQYRHILVTVSQEFKAEFGAGFNYTALVRFAERMIAERVVWLVGKWA